MTKNYFWRGFLVIGIPLLLLTAAAQWLFTVVGEVNLSRVVRLQLSAPPPGILFLSGINQQFYEYKMLLLDTVRPEVVAIGSSRAMQMRDRFFSKSFINLGGSVTAVPELERVVTHIEGMGDAKPKLALVFVDPWWFNPGAPNFSGEPVVNFPRMVSADLVWQGLKDLLYGNWVRQSLESRNLGIFAELKKAGFSGDGGYNYVGTIDGQTAADVGFAAELGGIRNGTEYFVAGAQPDSAAMGRMCSTLNRLRHAVGHVVVVAPPLAGAVWGRMSESGRYSYIQEAFAQLESCSPGFMNVTNPADIPGAGDCEFYDGVHYGNTIAARILRMVAQRQPQVAGYLNTAFIDSFIPSYAGFAGGVTLMTYDGMREVDFLRLGCAKGTPKSAQN